MMDENDPRRPRQYGKKVTTAAQQMEAQYFNHPRMEITSPFRNGEVDARLKYQPELVALPRGTDGFPPAAFAAVVSESNDRDADGLAKRFMLHPVRVECLHWAPRYLETWDCRFGCSAAKVYAATT